MRRLLSLLCMMGVAALLGCGGDAPVFETELTPARPHLTYYKDGHGRYVNLRGINVGGTSKVPRMLDVPLDNGRDWSFVGRPFPEGEADLWMAHIRSLGFNSIRLIFLWESVFPDAYGEPDEDFLDYFEEVVAAANRQGIYVVLNLHENLWSRHLYALFNERAPGIRGDIDHMLFAMLPCAPGDEEGSESCLTRKVVGDGAPLWATELCLPEKDFDSPYWGRHHAIGRLAEQDPRARWSYVLMLFDTLNTELQLIDTSTPEKRQAFTDMLDEMQARLDVLGPFDYTESTDMLPLTSWWENTILSLDISRCYASFFAGDEVFPDRVVENGELKWRSEADQPDSAYSLKDYLQSSWADAWGQVAARVGKYPNVIGYDLINEPAITSVMLTVVALYFELGGFDDTLKDILNALINYDISDYVWIIDSVFPALSDPTKGPCEDRCARDAANLCGAPCEDDCDTFCYDEDNDTTDETCFDLCRRQVAECSARRAGCLALLSNQIETCVDYCRDPDRDQAVTKLIYLLKFLQLLPPDTSDETREAWGMDGVDAFAAAGLNFGFDTSYLKPLFERTAAAIREGDDDAVIWLVTTGSSGLQGDTWMTMPANIDQAVYAPHWYPDIYPFVGLNVPERDFEVEEVRYREYADELARHAEFAAYSLSNIPVVYGEFGTYWNYKYRGEEWPEFGYIQSRRNEYRLSAEILNNYYEAFEELGFGNFVWCYTTDNHPLDGDGWNREDFSLVEFIREDLEPNRFECLRTSLDEGRAACLRLAEAQADNLDDNGFPAHDRCTELLCELPARYVVPVPDDAPEGYMAPRGHMAWMRPYAKVLSGKPLYSHFNSDFHYYDPDKGIPDPRREFKLVFAGKESDAPTVIFVPTAQYPDGFYVWLSDGWAAWDAQNQELYYHPEYDKPGWEHRVRIRPPIEGQKTEGFDYFIHGDRVVTGS